MASSNKPKVISQVKGMLTREDIKVRFNDILGKKAPQFMASLVNVVAASKSLNVCDPNSIMAAAFVAASYDLPIDSNLGFAAIVPYKNSVKDPATNRWVKVDVAQFQMMYKGFIQLAIRSGEYEKMNCSEVFEDELTSYNPITGECVFVSDFSRCSQRMNGEMDKVIGYYAWFRLRSGFVKELYMTKAEIDNHARKYSQSYRYDIDGGKQSSRWSTDFDSMARKTVIKLLLSRWGILSVDMQRAIQDDQKTYDENGKGEYGDNQPDPVVAEDPFVVEGKPALEAGSDESDEPEELDITNMA